MTPNIGRNDYLDLRIKRRRMSSPAVVTICQQCTTTPEPSTISPVPPPGANMSTPSVFTPSTVSRSEPSPIPSKPFPFMRLPAELRLNVYRQALCRPTPLYLHLDRKAVEDDNPAELAPSIRDGAVRAGRRTYAIDKGEVHVASEDDDALNPALLRTCKLVYGEARHVLYAENDFVLQLQSAVYTLSRLHQQSRSQIKSVILVIDSYHDIIDGFADLIRLGLRYCWGLKKFTLFCPHMRPDDKRFLGKGNVYANAFHILRWLPKGCIVKLEGNPTSSISAAVLLESRLQKELSDQSYVKRQHVMPERF